MIEIFLSVIVLLAFNMSNVNSSSQDLELSIRTQKSRYAVGEAIFLEIGLSNNGGKEIRILKYFMLPADDPHKNNLTIHVYDEAGDSLSRVSHVLTGRALYRPQIHSLSPGETYSEALQVAGTFVHKKETVAFWNLGEDPVLASANEYPKVTPGKFKLQVVYLIDKSHLTSLTESESAGVWNGKLISNTLEISIG